jgi:error-prone DNA polymerase
MTNYTELQVTTPFSFLRGASHAEELVAQAKHLGLAGIAVTDRNSLAGAVRVHAAAKEAGLNCIIGARLDLVSATPGEQPEGLHVVSDPAPACSLLAWPTDRAAYGNLCRLISLGQRRAGKGECLITLDDVAEFQQGLIFCAVPPPGWPDDAFEAMLKAIIDRLDATPYLAATFRHDGRDKARLNRLTELEARHGTQMLATNDVHFHHPARKRLADVMACIREGTTIDEAGYLLAPHAEGHLKPPQEMARLFRDHPQAITRTNEIAEACTFSLDELKYEYPDEPVPKGTSPQKHLEALTWAGAKERYPEGLPDKVRANLVKELALIGKLGYAPYFLTVHDIVNFARTRPEPILCQGRGSAANSAVCYCIGITAVDPAQSTSVRTLHLGGAQRAARHRRGFRTRAPRRGDPVYLRPLWPRAGGACGHRHYLPAQISRARGGQGDGPVGRRDVRPGRHRLGPHVGRDVGRAAEGGRP